MEYKKHLARLEQVWLDHPIVFITTCTANRQPVLANAAMHDICLEVWKNCRDRYGWVVGRYVIMPDHVHFFVHREPTNTRCRNLWESGKSGRRNMPIAS